MANDVKLRVPLTEFQRVVTGDDPREFPDILAELNRGNAERGWAPNQVQHQGDFIILPLTMWEQLQELGEQASWEMYTELSPEAARQSLQVLSRRARLVLQTLFRSRENTIRPSTLAKQTGLSLPEVAEALKELNQIT